MYEIYSDAEGQYTDETLLEGIRNHTIISMGGYGTGMLNLLSLGGLSFLLHEEGWSGGSLATAHEPATAKATTDYPTVGPGLTSMSNPAIKSGATFTFEQILDMFATHISGICDTIEKVCPELKEAGQPAVDMAISLCYNGGSGHASKFKGCKTKEQAAQILRGGPSSGGTSVKVSLAGRRNAEAMIAEENEAARTDPKAKWYYEIDPLAEEIMKLKGTYIPGVFGDDYGSLNGQYEWVPLSPGKYPYALIPPYKGFKAYDLRQSTLQPLITHQELDAIIMSYPPSQRHNAPCGYGPPLKLRWPMMRGGNGFYASDSCRRTMGYRNRNLCDVSVSKGDVGVIGTTTAGDGQSGFGIFSSFEAGMAAALKLIYRKYRGKSIIGIDNGTRGYYRRGEDISLTALRLHGIASKCKKLGIPDCKRIIDMDDKDTLISFCAAWSNSETGAVPSWNWMYQCYAMAFGR